MIRQKDEVSALPPCSRVYCVVTHPHPCLPSYTLQPSGISFILSFTSLAFETSFPLGRIDNDRLGWCLNYYSDWDTLNLCVVIDWSRVVIEMIRADCLCSPGSGVKLQYWKVGFIRSKFNTTLEELIYFNLDIVISLDSLSYGHWSTCFFRTSISDPQIPIILNFK